jgi:Ser/Thr protein kinase RdoA (MazF antagonist)
LDSTPAASKKMYDVLQRLAHELNRSDSQLSVLLANAQRKALAEGAKKEVPRLEEEVRALEEMLAARRLELEACERLVQVVPESLVPATRDMVRALYRQMVQDGMPEGDALASALVLSDGVA